MAVLILFLHLLSGKDGGKNKALEARLTATPAHKKKGLGSSQNTAFKAHRTPSPQTATTHTTPPPPQRIHGVVLVARRERLANQLAWADPRRLAEDAVVASVAALAAVESHRLWPCRKFCRKCSEMGISWNFHGWKGNLG